MLLPLDSEALDPVMRLIEDFADRLPPGPREDDVRRSLTGTLVALHEETGIEVAVRELVVCLHQLDEDAVGGRRREFQRNTPAVGRLLEVLQERLFPILRRAGYQV